LFIPTPRPSQATCTAALDTKSLEAVVARAVLELNGTATVDEDIDDEDNDNNTTTASPPPPRAGGMPISAAGAIGASITLIFGAAIAAVLA